MAKNLSDPSQRCKHPLVDVALDEAVTVWHEGAEPIEVGHVFAYALLGAPALVREQAERRARLMAARGRLAINFDAVTAVYAAVDAMRADRIRSSVRRGDRPVRPHRARRLGRSA